MSNFENWIFWIQKYACISNIFVNFLVTKEGRVGKVNVVRGLTVDYNAEAERVLSEMSGWTPAQKRGQPHSSTYSLNLRFTE